MDHMQEIKRFLESNIRIKKLMIDLAPKESYMSLEGAIYYSDLLTNKLNEMEYYLENMLRPLHNNSNFAKEMINSIKEELNNANINYSDLKEIYERRISKLDPVFVDYVNETCLGYSMFGTNISMAKTINELTHILHSELINSNEVYDTIPTIKSKQTLSAATINLRGDKNEIAEEIFNNIELTSDVGQTDILGIDDKQAFIMVRDKGHALTIEINKKDNNYEVNYFIPKICNYEMVNNLNGVTKVNKDSKYTKGMFNTNNPKESVIDLINNVPTDEDMFKEGGMFYNQNNQSGKKI